MSPSMPHGTDPELAALVEPFAWIAYTDETIADMRAMLAVSAPEPGPGVECSDETVDEELGLVCRVHRPNDPGNSRPAILSMHGGGYVIGNRSLDDARLGRLCARHGVIGISVEYRLAPEHPYPAAIDDCYTALGWVVANADRLGVDPTRIGIAGVSAGGGLAAALALLARDRGEFPVALQILEAPMLDDRLTTASSSVADLPMWSREACRYGWDAYLGASASDVPAYAAAARAEDFAGLPPAFVSVGAIDLLRDESIDHARHLAEAGVSTELHVYAGAPHGFQLFTGTVLADRANRDLDEWLDRHLASPAADPTRRRDQ